MDGAADDVVDDVVVQLGPGREARNLAVVTAVLVAVLFVDRVMVVSPSPKAQAVLLGGKLLVLIGLYTVGSKLVREVLGAQLRLTTVGIRRQRGHRVPMWSIPWGDLASATVVRDGRGATLLLEPRDDDVRRRHRGAGRPRRHGTTSVWRVELGAADAARVRAALAARVPRSRG